MSGVRVLVGTRKGAFVLTSDGKRERLGRQRSAFRRLGDLPPQGIARRPESHLCLAVQRLVRTAHPAFGRRRQDVGAGREQVRLRRRAGHAPVVRRHAAPVGVQARLAPRAVADRSRHGLRRCRGCGALPHDRRRPDVGGASGPARPRLGAALAAGSGRAVPPHHHRRSAAIRHGSSSPSRPPARSAPTMAARRGGPINRGLRSEGIPDADAEVGHCVHHIAMHPSRPDALFMQKHWDVMRSDDAGESWQEVSGNLPSDFGFRDRRARPRAGDDLRRADQERLGALSA